MTNFLIKLLFIIILPLSTSVKAQGIRFNSNDNLITDRTSYNVFAHNQPKFRGDFNIEFDVSIKNPEIFGYVLYIKDKNNPVSYSLAYVIKDENLGEFKLNLDGVKTVATVPIKKELLGSRKWIKISLNFNPTSKKIKLVINDKASSFNGNKFIYKITPEIYFGKHENVIEVPVMAIKNLHITNESNKYTFNFNESKGNDVFDITGNLYGNVNHPNWLITESYHWKLRHTKKFKQVTSVTFDENNNRFIFQNSDTLNFYNFKNETNSFYSFNNELPVPMRLGTSFLDPLNNKLYVYELNDVLPEKSTIASIDLNNPQYWQTNSLLELPQQRHHHNAFFDSNNNQFMIFGGYGNQRLTNEFNVYNIENDTWESLSFSGDTISPRYFSGLTAFGKDELILFGGQGNKTGDPSIGKTYYYDCYKVNIATKKIQKLWNAKSKEVKMVSSRNLVIAKDSASFYTLSYPEYVASTFLQLYEYSIKDGSHRILGDSIPMISERIRTNTNLYLDKSTNQLFCATQEFELDGSNKVSIYSLNAPPVSKEIIYHPTSKSNSNRIPIYIILSVIVLLLISAFLIIKRKKKKEAIQVQVQTVLKYNLEEKKEEITRPNSTTLFGSFKVIDSKERDISYLFSPKIRQLFLLLLFNSKQKDISGITSEQIHTELWPDSTTQKAQNLKNVTLNQLRNILKDIDGLEVVFSHGHFFIEFGEEFYCDYFNFLTELKSLKSDLLDENSLTQLIQIIKAGTFLQSNNDECFDKVKKDFEYEVLKLIPNQLKRLYKNKDYASVIPLTEILFNIDSLNETAFYYRIHSLLKMKMTFKAKKQFNYFIIEYTKIMGDHYPYTYKDVIKQIPDELK
tara:strand:+ start:13335 stop:15890 length:2556 start_codon:yes stop_codon:yes gene_type:complete